MVIEVQIGGLGTAGSHIWSGFSWWTNTGIQGGGEFVYDPEQPLDERNAAFAARVRESVRSQDESVNDDTPVELVGGIVRL